MNKEQCLITVNNIAKSYGDKQVLKDISFDVCAGHCLAVIGPSGCGKSTVLKIISGLVTQTRGDVILDSTNIGMAFQYSALLNSYTVAENVMMALLHSNYSLKEKHKIVDEKLEILGLEEYKNSMPDSLSGGQQKRVSFARAIANNPKIILYDEPTAGLDPISSTIVEDYITLLTKEYQTASIVVTHQHSTINRASDKIICLFEGLIVWAGAQAELQSTDNKYIRQFIDGKTEGPFTAAHS